MTTRGRKSAAALAVAAPSLPPQPLPEPPSYLTPAQEDLWRMVIASRGGDLIAPESFPVLVEYCRAVTAANQIAAQIDQFDPEWAKDEEGLKRWNTLHQMADRMGRNVASFAAKLRLTPSSRVQAISAGRNANKGPKLKPWEFEAHEANET
jgi:phage terminase small subunit